MDGAVKPKETQDGPTRSTRTNYSSLKVTPFLGLSPVQNAPMPSSNNSKNLDALKKETGLIPEGAGNSRLPEQQLEQAKVQMHKNATAPQTAQPGF